MVNKVFTGKNIFRHFYGVYHAFIVSYNFFNRNTTTQVLIEIIVNQLGNVILHIALIYQPGLFVVFQVGNRNSCIFELVNLVAFETVQRIPMIRFRALYTWIVFGIFFLEVIPGIVGFAVRDIQYKSLIHFANGKVGSIRSGNNFKTVVEKLLAFIINLLKQFY